MRPVLHISTRLLTTSSIRALALSELRPRRYTGIRLPALLHLPRTCNAGSRGSASPSTGGAKRIARNASPAWRPFLLWRRVSNPTTNFIEARRNRNLAIEGTPGVILET